MHPFMQLYYSVNSQYGETPIILNEFMLLYENKSRVAL